MNISEQNTIKDKCFACGDEMVAQDGIQQQADEMYVCKNCGSQRALKNVPGSLEYYQSHVVYKDIERDDALREKRIKQRRAKKLLKGISKGRLLDIGCGTGAFVAIAREWGFNASGIDFNNHTINIGRESFNLGDSLYVGNIENIIESNSYDIISMFEVVEHVPDPNKLMSQVCQLLSERGTIILSCPNEDRWMPVGRIFADFPPHHLSRWTIKGMDIFMQKHGLRIRKIILDASFRDIIWTALSNYRASSKNMQIKASNGSGNKTRSTLRRWLWNFLEIVLYIIFYPLDAVLKILGIGTMGMTIIADKR